MKLIVLRVLLNYFHRLTSRFVTCSAYCANKGRTGFQYRQRELCPLLNGHERQNYTTVCSTDNKNLMFIGPCITLLDEIIEPNRFLFMKVFYCSTCFEFYYIHPQELVIVCGCTALFGCVMVYWCGSAAVGWYPNAGWSTCKTMHGPINIR